MNKAILKIQKQSLVMFWLFLISTILIWPFLSQCGQSGINRFPAGEKTNTYHLNSGDKVTFLEGGFGDTLIKSLIDPSVQISEKTFTFDNIYFDTGSAALNQKSQAGVNNIASVLKAFPSVQIMISGHTDNVGDPALNQSLSLSRATSIAKALENKKSMGKEWGLKALGKHYPVLQMKVLKGRKLNRRIELKVTNR